MGTCGRTVNSENLHIEARKEKLLNAKLLGHHEARIGTPCKRGTGTERHPGDFSVPGPPSTKSNYSNTKINWASRNKIWPSQDLAEGRGDHFYVRGKHRLDL